MKKVVFAFLFLLCVVYLAGGLFTSVDFDAGVCSGGFDKHLIDTEIQDIEKTVCSKLTEEQRQNLTANSVFVGRKIYTYYKDSENTVRLIATKVWYGKYKWEKAKI